MSTSSCPAKRAERLVRLYPKAWRARYGEEFFELLAADIADRPRSWRRTADLLRGGLVARCSLFGLCGCALSPLEQVRASLVTLGCSTAVFLLFGAAMWSQLTIGWQWSRPDTAATVVATVVMSVAMFALVILAVLAAAPVLWSLVSRLFRGGDRLGAPTAMFLLGAVVLFVGGRHFGNGWPGTGGHPWSYRGLVPGGLAAFSWASTLSVSSYWAHPAALARFPAAELTWMALSPLSIVCVALGANRIVRRVRLSTAVLRYEVRLARVACLAMLVFLAGAAVWLLYGGPGPRNLFHAGAIDVAGAAVAGLILIVAERATQVARRGVFALAVR